MARPTPRAVKRRAVPGVLSAALEIAVGRAEHRARQRCSEFGDL